MAQRTGLIEGTFMIEPLRLTDLLYPQAKKARTIPFGSGDREGDLGEAVIGLAIPGKTVSHHHYPLRSTIPFADQYRARRQLNSLLIETDEARGYRLAAVLCVRPIENLPCLV